MAVRALLVAALLAPGSGAPAAACADGDARAEECAQRGSVILQRRSAVAVLDAKSVREEEDEEGRPRDGRAAAAVVLDSGLPGATSLAAQNTSDLHSADTVNAHSASDSFSADAADVRFWLARGLEYAGHPNQPVDARRYLTARGKLPLPWPSSEDWVTVFQKAVLALDNEDGVYVDDHKGTPIGAGASIGLVAAVLQMDPAQLELLPPAFQKGLFERCPSSGCDKWPVALRFSHTYVRIVDTDLLRIAMKVYRGEEKEEANLLMTETLQSFPIANADQLRTFVRFKQAELEVKLAEGAQAKIAAALRHLRHLNKLGTAIAMKKQAAGVKDKYQSATRSTGAFSKTFNSLAPFRIGDTDQPGAFRFRLKPLRSQGLLNAGRDCWIPCEKKGGYCDWCGLGNACCRLGFPGDPRECRGASGFRSPWWSRTHECVVAVKPWKCHRYANGQDDGWCSAQSGKVVAGEEYFYDRGGSRCGGCSCCVRAGPKRVQDGFPAAGKKGTTQFLNAMRKQVTKTVMEEETAFDFQIQVATDPHAHPLNDLSKEWATASAPWVTMGRLTVPKQTFPSAVQPVDEATAVGSGLWVGEHAVFNSKELLFAPGDSPHTPLGDVNLFRSHLYGDYDKTRQEHLLGKSPGDPAKCPFLSMKIMEWARDEGRSEG